MPRGAIIDCMEPGAKTLSGDDEWTPAKGRLRPFCRNRSLVLHPAGVLLRAHTLTGLGDPMRAGSGAV